MKRENNFTENNLEDIYGAVNFINDLMDNHLAPEDEEECEVYRQVQDLLEKAWCVLRDYLFDDEEGEENE